MADSRVTIWGTENEEPHKGTGETAGGFETPA